MDNRRFVIIGAGVAGLAAACRLVDKGIRPLILEAAPFPSHKVCGEFFSPECLPQLKRWGIEFTHTIDKALFCSGQTRFELQFKNPAGAMSHLSFDPKLLDYAKRGGAELFTEVRVQNVTSEKRGFQIQTEKMGTIDCSHLFIAAGRLPFFSETHKPLYIGQKAHFSDLDLQAPLMMFSFKGCYVGISEVEKGVYNVAMISSRGVLPTLDFLGSEDKVFSTVFRNGKLLTPWMTASIPGFGMKKTPHLPNGFFIGDAEMTIPPVSGAGLALSIASGIQSVDFALDNDSKGYREASKKRRYLQIRSAQFLHQCLLRPWCFKTFSHLPKLGNLFFNLTREKFFL